MNPLLNAMRGAGMVGGGQNVQMMQTVQSIMNMVRGKDASAVANMMMHQNPQFAQFVRDNQGKTPEQVAAQYGLDFNQIRSMIG